MLIYNRTKVPDDALKPLVRLAGRSVGARYSRVPVFVGETLDRHLWKDYDGFLMAGGGVAYRASRVRISSVFNTLHKKRRIRKPVIDCDGGYIYLKLATRTWDTLGAVEAFFNVLQHEMGHIRDYQFEIDGRGKLPWDRGVRGGRRGEHRWRPEERRVAHYMQEAHSRGLTVHSIPDEALAMAIAIEEAYPNVNRSLT